MYARSPPSLTIGGMVAFGGGMIVGALAANGLARYVEGMDPTTANPTLPSGITSIQQYNDLVMSAPPSLKRTAVELGVAALGFLGGGLLARGGYAIASLIGYGFGFGALADIGTALIEGYLIVPMFLPNGALTNTGARMFQHEATATTAAKAAKAAGGATLGAPNRSRNGTPVAAATRPPRGTMPAHQPGGRVPAALAIASAFGPGGQNLEPQWCPPGCPPAGQTPTQPPPGQPPASTQQPPQPPPAQPPQAPPAQPPAQQPTAPPPTLQGPPTGGSYAPGSSPTGCAPDCNCGTCSASTYGHPLIRMSIVGPRRIEGYRGRRAA